MLQRLPKVKRLEKHHSKKYSMKNTFFVFCLLFSLSISAQSSDTLRILPK